MSSFPDITKTPPNTPNNSLHSQRATMEGLSERQTARLAEIVNETLTFNRMNIDGEENQTRVRNNLVKLLKSTGYKVGPCEPNSNFSQDKRPPPSGGGSSSSPMEID